MASRSVLAIIFRSRGDLLDLARKERKKERKGAQVNVGEGIRRSDNLSVCLPVSLSPEKKGCGRFEGFGFE